MIFLVLSGKMIFLFPENMILFFRHKRKDDLSQKNTWKYDIFFRCFGNMVFPDNSLLNTIFFVISEFLCILRNFEEHDFLQNTPDDCFWSSNYFLFFYEDLLQAFLYIAFQGKKSRKLNIYDLNLTSSSICIVGDISSGVAFRGVYERQLKKLFVHQEMDYNSENIRSEVQVFQCRSRPNLSENVCQQSRESNQNQGSYEQKGTTYFKSTFT